MNEFACVKQNDEVLKICTNIIGARDEYTQGHSHHVHVVVEAIISRMSCQSRVDVSKLKNAALLHDIGKKLIPDRILNKDGHLSKAEWMIMRMHPKEGKKLLEGTLFDDLGDWILYHHERMDGKGYYGLSADDIPLESRIIAVADTFSALRTYRAYRPAKSIDEAVDIIRNAAGTQLDAGIVETFLSLGKDALENLQCNCDICAHRRSELKQQGQAI